MARAHFVEKARKDNSVVKKGESYWWWKFRFGGKQYSKDKPRRSQLTQSAFLGQMYEIEDRVSLMGFEGQDDAEGQIEEVVGDLQNLMEEVQESLDNMPEHLQETSSSGELLTERLENVQEFMDELEAVDLEIEDLDDESSYATKDDFDNAVESFNERIADMEGEVNDLCYNGG